MKQPIYFDNAAATPLDDRVLAAMQPYFKDSFYNPSANYLRAKKVKEQLEKARARVAHWLGAKPTEIIFTSGGTEANNLAIRGIMDLHPSAEVLISAVEHDSVIQPAKQYRHITVAVNKEGLVDLEDFKSKITDKTLLVSVMYANNEVGTIEPIKDIAQEINNVRKNRLRRSLDFPIYLHTDAAQAPNYLDLHVSRLGADLMTLNGGKIYGPKQSGILFVKSNVRLNPQIVGGGQEFGLRSGTENVAGAIGFSKALDIAQELRGTEVKRLTGLQQLLVSGLQEKIKGLKINGSLKKRLPANVHFSIKGVDNERLITLLDQEGYLIAAGSACSAAKVEASHVLLAMGLSEDDARSSIRLSMGRSTAEIHIKSFISKLPALVAKA